MKTGENPDHFRLPERANCKRVFALIVRTKEKLRCFQRSREGRPAKKVPPR
jgi:hypothetical protein